MLNYDGIKSNVDFKREYLETDADLLNYETIVNICIVYELGPNLNNYDFTLETYLFGSVSLTKNNDVDKYKCSGYGNGFDLRETFLFPDGSFAQNVIIFGIDMSSSVHVNNKTKNILILGEGVTQGLDDTTLTAEKSFQSILLKVIGLLFKFTL